MKTLFGVGMYSVDVSIVSEFLLRYGEKAFHVLKMALEVSEEYSVSGKYTPGDFDTKGLVRKLREKGIRYNPTQLLRVMEREYGIIETTYRTSTQHWWSFVNKEAVIEALRIYEGGEDDVIDDPELMVLDLQVKIVDINRILSELKRLRAKVKLTLRDKERLMDIIINELPNIASIVKNALKYSERYKDFILKFKLLIKLANDVIVKMKLDKRVSLIKSDALNDVRIEVDNEEL